MQFKDSPTAQVTMNLFSDGLLHVLRGGGNGTLLGATPGSAAFLTNVHYHVEWKVVFHPTTGSITVWINEVQQLALTNIDTTATANNTANQIFVGAFPNTNANNAVFKIDDLVVRDDQQITDVQVMSIFPDGTGATDQWTATGAATTREAVDEATPNSDTDYMSTSTVNDRSLHTYGNIPTTATPHAVIAMPFAKKTDAGTAKFKSTVRLSGVNYDGDEKAPSDGSYEYQPHIWMLNPGTTAAWTAVEVNGAEFGAVRTA